MKKIVFILVLVLVLTSCAKEEKVEEQVSKTSEIAKTTESKTETTTQMKSEETTQTISENTSEVVEGSSSAENFLSAEDSIKYGKKLREIFENIKASRGYPDNTEIKNAMLGDLDNDGSIDAIITVRAADRAYSLFYLRLEEDDLDKQIGTEFMYENIDYIGFEIVKIKGNAAKVPILSVDFEGENGSGFNLYYLVDASLGLFFENYDEFFMGYRYLGDLDSDGVNDCYWEDETSVRTLGESVSRRIDFVEYDKRVPATAFIMSSEETKTPEETVIRYIKLSHLYKILGEEDYYVSDLFEELKTLISDDMGDYLAWTPSLLENTFANINTAVLEFERGEETVNKSGNKVYEIKTKINGTYYEKSLGNFEEAKTIYYDVEEIDGKFVIISSRLEDADWPGMDEVYQSLFFPRVDGTREYEIGESVYDAVGERIGVKTEFIYKDESKTIGHITVIDESNYLDGEDFDYYFLEELSSFYILSPVGFDNYMLTGDLDENSMLLLSHPFDEFKYEENVIFSNLSVEKDNYNYICTLDRYDDRTYVLRFVKGKGLEEFSLIDSEGTIINAYEVN